MVGHSCRAGAKFNAALIRKLLGGVSWGRIRLPICYFPDAAGTPLTYLMKYPTSYTPPQILFRYHTKIAT